VGEVTHTLVAKRVGVEDALTHVNATLLLAALTFISIALPPNPLAQATILVGPVLLLGACVFPALHLQAATVWHRTTIATGLGLLAVFLLGGAFGAVLPHLGVSHPLVGNASKITWSIVVALASIAGSIVGSDPVRDVFAGVTRRQMGWALMLCVPPIISLIGVQRLNAGGSASPALLSGVLAMAMVIAAVLVPVAWRGPSRVLLLMSALVTAAWEGPMRGGFLFGGDLQHEYYVGGLAIHQGVFPLHGYSDPYAGMLPLTVWPAVVHSLSGLTLRATLSLLPAVILGLCLAATWCTVREWVEERTAAVLCALLLLGSTSMIREMPAVTRQCYSLLFFTLLVMAVASRRLPTRTARVLAVSAGLGLAVTHYNSAYIAACCALGGWLLSLAVQRERPTRVLTTPVTACIVGAAALWGALLAKTTNSFSRVLTSIQHSGFRFLPSGGSIFTKWIRGANISKLVDARIVRTEDREYRRGIYAYMSVDPRATSIHLINVRAPVSSGAPVIGLGIGITEALLTELILLSVLVSVVVCLWRIRTDRSISELAGMAVVGVVIAAISRSSQTLAVQFGPTRIQLQTYMMFAVTLSVALSMLPARARFGARLRPYALGVVAAIVAVSVLTSTELSSVLQKNAQLVAYYSTRGDQVERIPTIPDLEAGRWLVLNRGEKLIQTDWDGQYVLYTYGFATRSLYIRSIDPIITDNSAWVLATRSNVVLGVARGGDFSQTGVYRFPRSYFVSTRSVLYASPTDVVFGSDPSGGRMARHVGKQGNPTRSEFGVPTG
jgi:hypothetical protein